MGSYPVEWPLIPARRSAIPSSPLNSATKASKTFPLFLWWTTCYDPQHIGKRSLQRSKIHHDSSMTNPNSQRWIQETFQQNPVGLYMLPCQQLLISLPFGLGQKKLRWYPQQERWLENVGATWFWTNAMCVCVCVAPSRWRSTPQMQSWSCTKTKSNMFGTCTGSCTEFYLGWDP